MMVLDWTADAPQGVLRDNVISIKFLDAYFGTEVKKLRLHLVTKMFHLL